jgi:hypothetical protein
MTALAKAQTNTEDRMAALVEAQIRTEQAQANTEIKMVALAEAQTRTEGAFVRLAEAQAHTDRRLDVLIDILSQGRDKDENR